jgi:hypothetical protein
LQPRLNRDLRSSSSVRKKGLLGTTLIHLMLFGLLILAGFSTSPPVSETGEGILVNFGTGETGIGDIEPSPPAGKQETSPPPTREVVSPPATSKVSTKIKNEPVLTQNNEEAPVVKKADPEAVRKKLEKTEADKKIK